MKNKNLIHGFLYYYKNMVISKGASINYVRFFGGRGVCENLTFSDKGGGEVFKSDVII